MKIVHTPYNVANNPRGICDSEVEQGLFSKLEILHSDGFFDTADKTWSDGSIFMREFFRWPLMIKVLLKYDVIHYNNGSFISPRPVKEEGKYILLKKLYNRLYAKPLEGIDIKIAHFLKKTIFVTFQGSDARLISFSKNNYEFHFSKEENAPFYETDDIDIIRKVNLFDKYADRIFALNPDLLNTLPKRSIFTPYASVNPDSFSPIIGSKNKNLTLVHAPSNRLVKGTEYLVNAVKKLQQENFKIDLVLIEGLTNIEALEQYKKADIVVDQLLAGWYGAFAVEVMSFGKPVIAYIRNSDLIHIPEKMKNDLPFINANQNSIYDVLKSILSDKSINLNEIGIRSRDFVVKWHNPKYVTKLIWKGYLK